MSRFIGEQIHHVRKTVERLHIRQSDDNPEDSITTQYGFMKFDENEPDKTTRPSQFIRLALDTNAETIVEFMKEAWHLPTPDLIISVTGGAKHFELPARLRLAFQLGLLSAAATTNAWIITAGTNAGVVTQVGGALNKYRYKNQKDGLEIPCIGIASWGYTAGKNQLDPLLSQTSVTSNVSKGSWLSKKPAFNFGINSLHFTGQAAYGMCNYVVKEKEEKRCALEPNHTHFLLLDDGTDRPEHILPLRADIEMFSRHIKKKNASDDTVDALIPIVMVLVEGGRSAIQCVCEALLSNTPVVVVKDSGRGADLIVDLIRIFSTELINHTHVVKNETKELQFNRRRSSSFAKASLRVTEINATFAKFRIHNPWIDDLRDDLCRLLNDRKQLITIYCFDNTRHMSKLEDAILEAVFNAAKFSNESNEQHRSAAELKLALAWNKVEYARQAIFTEFSITKWTKEDVRLGLVDAIRRGYIGFIELFNEFGTTFPKLTLGDLEYLYSTASIDKVLPLKKTRYETPTREEFYLEYMKVRLETCTDKNVPLGEHATRDLFIWAIFLDRFEFAVYLCSKTWNQAVAPLFGARLYKKAATMTPDSESKCQYETNAKKFDKFAATIIDQCFDVDRDFAINILRRPAVAFYNQNPLQLALKGDSRAFLASRCVQKYLDNEWFGNINYKRQHINIRIFFCSLFLPLLPIFFGILPYLQRHVPFNPNMTSRTKFSTASSSYTVPNTVNIRWTQKLLFFYRAPIVRFYYNLIFFFIFLGLFSYVLLVDFFPLNIYHGYHSSVTGLPIPIPEIWLHVCIWGIIIEEMRQFTFTNSFVEYLNEMSNLIDMTAIIFYLIGFMTRFIVIEEYFMISKIILCLDLILWYVRILHLFAAYEKLGPKLIMIFNTMKDLLFFVCFILIFLFGFSITSWSLLITTSQVQWIYDTNGKLVDVLITSNSTNTWGWKLLRDVTNYGVWKVFGQVDLVETTNSYQAVAFVLAILFVTISNVLLLNVLVALFNVTIENVQHESHDLWRYQRFLVVNEFRHKSLLPPPFNTLFCLISSTIRFIKRHRKGSKNHAPITHKVKRSFDVIDTTNDQFDHEFKIVDHMQRESAITEDFWRETLQSINKN
ncbi:unnamed protein product [Adineta steineri]|uniref:Uncharacterized protein n=1 Tax=Adineta steineri TaxID=433720 RepID=A0A818WDA3_9BILA|nr:unnamed protein product [Adineta steineri]